MTGRFVSVVGLYGPKHGPLRDFLAGLQALIAEHAGDSFRPYSLDQVHATLVALNGVRDPEPALSINDYYLQHTGTRRQMDFRQVMDIVSQRFSDPLRVRIGGVARPQEIPFERAFSVQGRRSC